MFYKKNEFIYLLEKYAMFCLHLVGLKNQCFQNIKCFRSKKLLILIFNEAVCYFNFHSSLMKASSSLCI